MSQNFCPSIKSGSGVRELKNMVSNGVFIVAYLQIAYFGVFDWYQNEFLLI